MFEILAILAIAIFPGYFVASYFKKLDTVERLGISVFITFLIIGGVGLLLHLFGTPLKYALMSLLFLPILLIFKRPSLKFSVPKLLLIVLLIAFLMRFVLQFAFDFTFGFDGFLHMVLAKTFATQDWFSVNVNTIGAMHCVGLPCPVDDRPPFYNFVMGFFFDLFGSSYNLGKLVSVVLGTLLVVPVFLIGRSFGKAGLFASIFIAVSPFFIGQSVDTEVRIMTAYAALMSFYFFTKKNFAFSFVMLGITFLTHYPESIILGLTYLVYFAGTKFRGLLTKQNILAVALTLLVISPWVIRNYETFGSPLVSSSERFVNLNSEYEVLLLPGNNPSEPKTMTQAVRDRAFVLMRAIFPVPYTGGSFNLNIFENENMINRSFIAFLTLPLAILAFVYLWGAAKKIRKEFDLILVYAVVGFAFAIAITNIIIPIELSILFPQVTILSVAAFAIFDKLKGNYRKVFTILIIAFIALQVGNYTLKLDVRRDFAQSWINENTKPDDTLMIRWTDTYLTNYLTGRSAVAIRYGSQQQFLEFVNSSDADYILIDNTDLALGDIFKNVLGSDSYRIDLDFLRKNFTQVATYNVDEKRIFKSHKNTYYIFKT